MKTLQIFSLAILAMIFAAACEKNLSLVPGDQSIKQMAAGDRASVEPEIIDGYTSGDAANECAINGDGCGDFAFKINNNTAGNEEYLVNHGEQGSNTITITNSDGFTFDWASDWPVCKVMVKAGTQALVYYYPGGSYGDAGLRAPERNNQRDNDGDGLINEDPNDGVDNDGDSLIDEDGPTTGEGREISHVTFCYDQPEACWEEETAWTDGTRYVNPGNWAMYSSKEALIGGVDIIADGGSCPTVIGTAILTDNGNGTATINISLTGGIFYYDVFDQWNDDNLKIQGYNNTPPKKNPAPGKFQYKYHFEEGAINASVTVPLFNYYGIHLDVALPCDHCQ